MIRMSVKRECLRDPVLTKYTNCLVLKGTEFEREDLWVRDGKIIDPQKVFFEEQKSQDQTVDCHGWLISPGYIDVQINGAFGIDFSANVDHIEEGVTQVSKGLLQYGVTSYCPTVVTSDSSTYRQILPHIRRREGGAHGAAVLGTHLEGPFISKQKKGAHVESFIKGFPEGVDDVIKMYGSLDQASIITLAPELKRGSEVTEELVKRGIVVSLGHSTANISQGEAAVCSGATYITHLFNAMLPFHHRDPGLVGLLSSKYLPVDRTLYYGLIADGIHTHPAALRIAQRVHPTGLTLVTDAISAMGLSEGVHTIGSQRVSISGRRAVIAGTQTLCGSIATMDFCVRHFHRTTGTSRETALTAATAHPADLLSLSRQIGSLDYGADADFVILDPTLHVHATYIAGEKVYEAAVANPAAKKMKMSHSTDGLDLLL